MEKGKNSEGMEINEVMAQLQGETWGR